jgi:hypothetical protein
MAASVAVTGMALFAALEIYLRAFAPPAITPGYTESHPARRYALKPLFRGRAYSASVAINSMGLRDYERPVRGDAYRIAVFGDSMAFGDGVALDKTFAKRLEAALNEKHVFKNGVQVFNLGVPGYNTVQEYLYITESYGFFRPEMIILEFNASNDTILVKGLGKGSGVPEFLKRLKDMLRGSYAYSFLVIGLNRARYAMTSVNYSDPFHANVAIYDSYYADGYGGWAEARNALKGIKSFCDRNHIVLVVALVGNYSRLSAEPAKDPMYPILRKVAAALDEAGIKDVVVLDEAFRKYAGREALLWVTPTDANFSELAHSLVAGELSDYITGHNLIHN